MCIRMFQAAQDPTSVDRRTVWKEGESRELCDTLEAWAGTGDPLRHSDSNVATGEYLPGSSASPYTACNGPLNPLVPQFLTCKMGATKQHLSPRCIEWWVGYYL